MHGVHHAVRGMAQIGRVFVRPCRRIRTTAAAAAPAAVAAVAHQTAWVELFGVGLNEVEVAQEGAQGGVHVRVDFVANGFKVHGLGNDLLVRMKGQ